MTGESVVEDCATAVVVVAGERASNRGMKNRFIVLQQQHICQRVTGKETGKNSPHWLHGATLERQPEMFDQAPEKRSLNRYTAVKRVCNLSVFNGTVKKQRLTKDSAVCPRSSLSNCANAECGACTNETTEVELCDGRISSQRLRDSSSSSSWGASEQ